MSVLVAGIGNIFLGDDGFGVEVARRLAARDPQPWSADVKIADFGIRGFDLAYALMDGYDHAILIDAVARGGAPGTVYLIEPGPADARRGGPEPHAMDPQRVLDLVARLGGTPTKVSVVACEPARTSEDDGMELSPEVAGAVDVAIDLVDEVLGKLLSHRDRGRRPEQAMEV